MILASFLGACDLQNKISLNRCFIERTAQVTSGKGPEC